MKIFLIRHGKSDKSLKEILPHDEFEFQRALVTREEAKARQLGESLKSQVDGATQFDLVWSGKMRSKQTVLAVARGLGLSEEKISGILREDFGLTYLTNDTYWEAAETAIKNGTAASHADFFLHNPPDSLQTFTAQYLCENMRSVLRRAIERNAFLKNEVSIMVSHEPVLSLCMSDLTGKSVAELGGSFAELEYAVFSIDDLDTSENIKLEFRGNTYHVGKKLFPAKNS